MSLDTDRVLAGKTLAVPEGDFRLGVFPRVFQKPAEVVVKRRTALPTALPEPWVAVSDYWEFDVLPQNAYNGKRPLIIELTIPPTTALTSVWQWNGKSWQVVPSVIVGKENNRLRLFLSVHFARFVVAQLPDRPSVGMASWYRYRACDCAASPDYPRGTKLRVENILTGAVVTVTVNDFGPDRSVHPDRVIDLDLVAFQKIAKKSDGVVSVRVSPVDQTL